MFGELTAAQSVVGYWFGIVYALHVDQVEMNQSSGGDSGFLVACRLAIGLWEGYDLHLLDSCGCHMEASMSLRFTQSCPTCGRRVEIRASLLGSIVACQHCLAEFKASAEDEVIDSIDGDHNLMARVERALGRVDQKSPA